jgi:hypothetical protein
MRQGNWISACAGKTEVLLPCVIILACVCDGVHTNAATRPKMHHNDLTGADGDSAFLADTLQERQRTVRNEVKAQVRKFVRSL